MKRRLRTRGWVSGIALLVALAPAWAEAPATQDDATATSDATGTPRIEFPVMSRDFGHQVAGADLQTTFDFKNVGDGILRVLQVKGG